MHDIHKTSQNPSSPDYPEDRRSSIRYLISGAARFQWQASDGQWHDAIGITQNIGKTGLFIESESLPPVASLLNLVVTLPIQWDSDITIRVGGTGRVCHVRQGPSQAEGLGARAVLRVEMNPPRQQQELKR